MTLTTIKTLAQVEQRFRRDELERTEIATELRLLRERLNSIYESQLSGGSSAPHSALTLDANADVFLSINAGLQILGTDVQGANKVFAGPTVAPDAHPNFRLLVDDDVPNTITLDNITQITTRNHFDLQNITPTDHHDPVTLDANADTLLSLSTQELGLDTQVANLVLAGPGSGAPAVPTFRALVSDDVITALLTPGTLTTTTTNVATGNHTHAITNTSDAAGTVSTILAGTAAGDLSLRRLTLDDRLIHDGDSDTYLEFTPDLITLNAGSELLLSLFEGVQNEVIINDGAASDVDFRVEGGGSPWALFMRGSDGNVGIGTAGPGAKLDIAGDVLLSGGAQNYLFTDRVNSLELQSQTTATAFALELFSNDGDGTDNINLNLFAVGTPSNVTNRERLQVKYETTGTRFEIFTEANGTGTLRPLVLYTEGNAEQLYLDTDGDVGIGTSSPATELDVNGDITMAGSLIHGGDTDTKIAYTLDVITFTAGGVALLTLTESTQDEVVINEGEVDVDFRIKSDIDSNAFFLRGSDGNIGIGSSGPDAKLDILNPSGAQLRMTHTDGVLFAEFTLDASSDLTIKPAAAGQIKLQPTTDSTDFFQVLDANGGTPVLNVDSINERVGIGTAAPTTPLDVVGAVTITDEIIHAGDTDTKMAFTPDVITFTVGAAVLLTLTEATQDEVVINEGGVDVDLRVETPFSTQTLFVEGSSGRVSINHGAPASALDINGSITVSDEIIHAGDTNTKMAFTSDTITFTAGNLGMLTLAETTQDLVSIGDVGGAGDVDVNFSSGQVFLRGSDGFLGIGTTNPATELDVNGDITISGGSQSYLFSDRSNNLVLQGQLPGVPTSLEFYSADGDGTDITGFNIFGVGTPGAITNRERLQVRYNSTNVFEIFTEANGTGTLRPLVLFTEGNPDQLRLETDGKVGINTTTIPHGGIGVAMLALDGPDSSSDGPHIQITTASDNYPLMQIHAFTHDNVGIGFDAYWNGAAEASADAGSNYTITKSSDLLKFSYASGAAQGTTPTFTVGLVMDTSGMVGVGTTANTKMTIGLTMDQGANDDEILAFQSTGDVSHGMTDKTETETFGFFRKASATGGGLVMEGYRDAGDSPVNAAAIIGSLGEAAQTTKTTGSRGVVSILSRSQSGLGTTDVGANGNLLAVVNNATTRWILDAEGDIFYGGSDDGTITDEHDDVHLLSGFRAVMSPNRSPARDRFKGFLREAEDVLVQQGVLTARLSSGGLVSDTALKGLIIDALIQITNRLNTLEEKKNGPI